MTDPDNRTAEDADVRTALGTSGQPPQPGLARVLSDLARQMQAAPTMEELLQRIVTAALREVESADHAGISEIHKHGVTTPAATDDLVRTIDAAQYRLKEGPCLTSLREHQTVRSDDLTDEPRWPRFADAAVRQGVRSMLSVQLFVEDDNLGALNLYAAKPAAFDETDESVAMLLAAHAAVAMKGTRIEQNLRTALASRDIIGQAKGILMERYRITATEAFDLLVVASQHSHRKLHDIADELTATGDLPTR